MLPEWLAKLVGVDGYVWTHPLRGEARKRAVRGSFDFVLKAVCKPCNNGWMHDIEEMARPLVGPMALGQPGALTVIAQAAVATWVWKLALVADHASTPPFFTAVERGTFMDTRRPTSFLRIFLVPCARSDVPGAFVNWSAPYYQPSKVHVADLHCFTARAGSIAMQALFLRAHPAAPEPLRLTVKHIPGVTPLQIWPAEAVVEPFSVPVLSEETFRLLAERAASEAIPWRDYR